VPSGHAVGVRAMVKTRPVRTFWWDRERVQADVLRAVIFDADSALAEIERDSHRSDGDIAPMAGLVDLVMSLFAAGVWVGVVSSQRRARVETLVRHLVGDGLVETIVTVEDLPEAGAKSRCDAEIYRSALWELGITPRGALVVAGSGRGLRAATGAGLPAVFVAAGYSAGQQFVGAAEVRAGYDEPEPLLAAGCQRAHRRWWIQRAATAA
jgi:beta-phosphoglucomutase-like phosphatase (HAD superfamily)